MLVGERAAPADGDQAWVADLREDHTSTRRAATWRPCGCRISASTSTPSTSRGPGRAKWPSASTAQTGTPGKRWRTRLRERRTAVEVEAAGRTDDEVGTGVDRVLPGDPARPGARDAERGFASGARHHLRDPVPGREGRVGPLQHEHPRAVPAGDPRLDRGEAVLERRDERRGLVDLVRTPTDVGDRRQDVGQGVGIDRRNVGAAAEVGERVVDGRDVDRADGAEVLRHHEVGVELGERARVEPVEVLARRQRSTDEVVDLLRSEAFGHRRRGHDPALARGRREVALERHPDHVVTRSDGEQDLGGRGDQGDDAHVPEPRLAP